MRQILNRSNPLELNTLFIQPTRWCALSCKNCYVKEHQGGEDSYHIAPSVLTDLFEVFYNNRSYKGYQAWANQITVSIDDLHNDPKKRDHMYKVFDEIMDTVWEMKNPPAREFEIHFTFHTVNTIKKYLSINDESTGIFRQLNMISISEINPEKDEDFIKDLASHTLVNYNHLVPSNITSLNIDRYVEKITKIGRLVNHIYLVMFKNPIGADRTSNLLKIGEQSRMASDIRVMNTLMERLPPDVKHKVSTDGCLRDVIKFKETGFGCSSNVSRVQVWPDGSVTGCAYAFGANNEIGHTTGNILDNIITARSRYEFTEQCHLPEVYNSIS